LSARLPTLSQTYTQRYITISVAGLTQSATVDSSTAYVFSLGDLDNAGAYQTMFDQYRIEAVRFVLRPSSLYQNATNTVTFWSPVYVVIDYDDATALSTAAAARAYDNCMILAPGEGCERTFVPRVAMAAYSGAFTSFANEIPPWIDAASPSVQHYGVKVYLPHGIAGQTILQEFIVEREYWVSFRKTR